LDSARAGPEDSLLEVAISLCAVEILLDDSSSNEETRQFEAEKDSKKKVSCSMNPL